MRKIQFFRVKVGFSLKLGSFYTVLLICFPQTWKGCYTQKTFWIFTKLTCKFHVSVLLNEPTCSADLGSCWNQTHQIEATIQTISEVKTIKDLLFGNFGLIKFCFRNRPAFQYLVVTGPPLSPLQVSAYAKVGSSYRKMNSKFWVWVWMIYFTWPSWPLLVGIKEEHVH